PPFPRAVADFIYPLRYYSHSFCPSLPCFIRLAIRHLPPDAVINEAVPLHGLRLKQVAAIEDHALAEQAAHDLEVGIPKLLPFRDNRQPVRPLQCSIGPIAVGQMIAIPSARIG